MTSADIRLLFEYDRWANGRVMAAVAVLSVEEFTRDLGGSFRSVRDTLLHIIGGEWIWIAYWKEPSDKPAHLLELRKRRDVIFDPREYGDVHAVQRKLEQVAKEVSDFVSRVSETDLDKKLSVRNTEIKLMHLMQHVANHSTYHRGQIAVMMRQMGKEPMATDFHVFMAEGGEGQTSKREATNSPQA